MNEKFVPASTKAFPLSFGIHGEPFSVTVSRKSGFDGFEKYTNLPCLHLTVATDNEGTTWSTWDPTGEKIGTVISIVRRRIPEIVKHFFGELLSLGDVATRFELNDQNSARRQTVHFHVEVGHKDLFGEDGFVRQCVQSLLRPELIGKESAATRTLSESDVERVIAAIEKLQPNYFRNVTIGFNHAENLYGMFVTQVTRTSNQLPEGEPEKKTDKKDPLAETNTYVDTPSNAKGM